MLKDIVFKEVQLLYSRAGIEVTEENFYPLLRKLIGVSNNDSSREKEPAIKHSYLDRLIQGGQTVDRKYNIHRLSGKN